MTRSEREALTGLKRWLGLNANSSQVETLTMFDCEMLTTLNIKHLSFELRREFALGNVGKYIPNLVHLIPTITKYKPQKRKNGKFCFGCFALLNFLIMLSLADNL